MIACIAIKGREMSSSNYIRRYHPGDIVIYENEVYQILEDFHPKNNYIAAKQLTGRGKGERWFILRKGVSEKLQSLEEILAVLI